MSSRIGAHISGVNISLDWDTSECGEVLKKFLKDFIVDNVPEDCFRVKFSPESRLIQFSFNHSATYECSNTMGMNVEMGHLDKDANYAVIPDVADQSVEVADFILDNFLRICLQYAIIKWNGVMLHASCVEEKGKSLIFVGPNDGGKSTIARNTGKKVLSDDCVGLRKTARGDWLASATPWGDVHTTGEYPVEAMFFIEKADGFYCEKVNPILALKKLFSNVSLSFPEIPKCSHDVLDGILGIVSEVCSEIPIYRLGFRKDDNVIELLEKEGILWNSEISITQ